jgi:hypothetical protein
MSQEGSIPETLLEILKLLAGGGLYWQESSWCGAPCAKPGYRKVNHL